MPVPVDATVKSASRLGRRPKRLKEVGGGEGSGGTRSHGGNLPIAPYPSPQELYRVRMAELQKIVQTNGTFKAELMQAFLSAAKASFLEHSKSGTAEGGGPGGKGQGGVKAAQQQMMDMAGLAGLSQGLVSSSGSPMPSSSTTTADAPAGSADNAGLSAGLAGVDSPSSMNSPGGSVIDFSNFAALDTFLFEHSLPSTPGGGGGGGGGQQSSIDAVAELQALNSPFNLNNVTLDPVSAATSPLSEIGMAGSPHLLPTSSSLTNGSGSGGMLGVESSPSSSGAGLLDNGGLLTPVLNYNANSNMASPQLQYQQQYAAPPTSSTTSPSLSGFSGVQIKTEPSLLKMEPCASFSSSSDVSRTLVKMEPISPEPTSTLSGYSIKSPAEVKPPDWLLDLPPVDVNSIMEEVRTTPSEDRRLLMEQVTDAVVEAHLGTTINTYKAIDEANRRITETITGELDEMGLPDMSKLKLEANNLWQQFVSAMVPEITSLVKFCKKLPGFVEIEQDDQIRLIKQGSFEVMLARFSLLVDHDKQTLIDPTHTMRASREVIREMPMGEFLDEFFFISSQFNPLKLTDGEIGLFCSILIVCPTRNNLKSSRDIGKIQSLFQQALYYLMRHNHPDSDAKFRQLMSLISTFHRINEEHFKALSNIHMDSPGSIAGQFPELHREIYGVHE